jgi:hypothetical protein
MEKSKLQQERRKNDTIHRVINTWYAVKEESGYD